MAHNLNSTFAQLKITALRHDLKGDRLVRLVWALLFGVAAITATIWASLPGSHGLGSSRDLLTIAFGLWTVGWILGPILVSGEDKTLRPEYFRFLPVSTRSLANGLLAGSFVSIGVVVTLTAFSSLVVYAWQSGWATVITALLALVLQLAFTVILSRVVTSTLREFAHSQLNVIISSFILAVMTAFFCTGWALFATENALPAEILISVADVFRILPFSWGIEAIVSAQAGNWFVALGNLAALATVTLLLKEAWAVLLNRRLTLAHSHSVPKKSRPRRQERTVRDASPFGAVIRKELVLWHRDYARSSMLYYALFFSIAFCLYPLFAGIDFFLVFMGAFLAITAASNTANIYATDGTAYWSTLLTPGASRHDVRGRQLAWLIIVAPCAVVLTLLGLAVTSYTWAIPGALTLVIATLGAGAGVFIFSSVFNLTPTNDANKRGDDIFDQSISWLTFVMLMVLTALLVAPAFGLVVAGAYFDKDWLEWLGVPVALGSGTLYYWWFGRMAYRRLVRRGPEFLNRMQRGPSSGENSESRIASLPEPQRSQVTLGLIFGPLIALQQGVVPMAKMLSSDYEAGIFLPLYLPAQWQWYGSIGMTLVGIIILAWASWVFISAKHVKT